MGSDGQTDRQTEIWCIIVRLIVWLIFPSFIRRRSTQTESSILFLHENQNKWLWEHPSEKKSQNVVITVVFGVYTASKYFLRIRSLCWWWRKPHTVPHPLHLNSFVQYLWFQETKLYQLLQLCDVSYVTWLDSYENLLCTHCLTLNKHSQRINERNSTEQILRIMFDQ